MVPDSVKLTLIFLLFNAEETVEALVEAALRQRHPQYPSQSEWLNIIFIDDCSQDKTLQVLERALEQSGPRNCSIIANEKNLGLSSTLNKVFKQIKTPYGLTCHLDVLFGSIDYVASMLLLMEAYPEAGAITGQPQIPLNTEISTAEKINIIGNLMDIFPVRGNSMLVPVGFAEGRCDIFRVEALRKAGFWDTTLRTSGEDQVLAARMRQKGYEIYQAPALVYYLSVSGEQNSIRKLLRHVNLFGRTQPYIFFNNNNISNSVGRTAGANRQARLVLRASHIAGVTAYIASVACIILESSVWVWLIPLVSVVLLKGVLFRRHLRVVTLTFKEALFFLAFVPLQDVYYTAGLIQGIWNCCYNPSERAKR